MQTGERRSSRVTSTRRPGGGSGERNRLSNSRMKLPAASAMRIKNLLLALVLFFPACAQPNSSSLYLTKHQALAITEKAREKVLANSVLNGAQEAQIVRTAEPTLTYYFLARPYADYDIRWTINSDEAI